MATTTSSAKRVLVTGAGGFVGANLARRLIGEGHDVTVAVSSSSLSWRLEAIKHDVRIVELDLRDWSSVRAAVAATGPAWVFHLAAHGAYSWETDVQRILDTNVRGTAALVDACVEAGTAVLVNAGSSSEYGFKDYAPGEDEPVEPNSAYAVGKSAATLYCRHAARTSGLRTVTLRLYSVYGPFEEPNRLIPQLIVQGLAGRLPPLVDPRTARDFVYVDDVVEAFLAATAARPGSVFNVGSGISTTIADLVDVARRKLGIEQEPDWGSHAARSWDTEIWISDSSRIADELGWRASTPLADGFARTVEWLRQDPLAERAYA